MLGFVTRMLVATRECLEIEDQLEKDSTGVLCEAGGFNPMLLRMHIRKHVGNQNITDEGVMSGPW